MMNDNEVERLWVMMEGIYDIGVVDGERKAILKEDLDLSNYLDNRCYNGYEPLESL